MITFLLAVLTQPVFAENLSGLCDLPGQQIEGVTPSVFMASKKLVNECRSQEGTHIAIVTHEPKTEEKFLVLCLPAPIAGVKSLDDLLKSYTQEHKAESKILQKISEANHSKNPLKDHIFSKNLISVYNFTGEDTVVSSKALNSNSEIANACDAGKARGISGRNKKRPCENFGEQGFIAKALTLSYFHFDQPTGDCGNSKKANGKDKDHDHSANYNIRNKIKSVTGDEATAQQPRDKKTGVGATIPGDES